MVQEFQAVAIYFSVTVSVHSAAIIQIWLKSEYC